MNIYQNLKERNIDLPPSPKAMGLYAPVKIAGNMAYVSGQGPLVEGKPVCTGKVGRDVTAEQAQAAARLIAINTLALLHEYVGDLNKIKSVVKVLGFVASAEGFNEQPAVINAFSQVFVDVFGENGRHARSAVGTNELPMDISVEIESLFEIATN
ncbi:MAG: RidA family protein [Oscillospiraceae bacterium]|nr:RidA family protein [Oscillospiraceae bacterium]